MNKSHDVTGAVIWITGYSAAGKTTIGRQVTKLLSENDQPAFFLDGDQLRAIFAHKWGYSSPERIELACTYFRLCSHLSKQGAVIVISAVAMFDEARQWFRQNVENGLEVYLRVPLAERMQRDERTKGIYREGSSSMDGYVEPVDADVVIDNFGEVNADKASHQVMTAFQERLGKSSVDYGRTSHWSDFYSRKTAVTSPSPFAVHCLRLLAPHQQLLEIGCGNGRDATYFAANDLRVTAIDKSAVAIEGCIATMGEQAIKYVCCDAVDIVQHVDNQFDVVYSRFSLHAMTQTEENETIFAAFDLLTTGGLFCIECRSINDPLARQGDVLSPSERISGHYRRFIVLAELVAKLEGKGFVIKEQVESAGLAIFGQEDPVVIRVVAAKR